MTPSESLPDAPVPDGTGSLHACAEAVGGHAGNRIPADECLLQFCRAVVALNAGDANGGKADRSSILSQVLPNLVRTFGRCDRASLVRLEQELWNWERGAEKLQQFAIVNCGESSQRLIDSLNRTRALAETVIESLKQLQPPSPPPPTLPPLAPRPLASPPRVGALEAVPAVPVVHRPVTRAADVRPRVPAVDAVASRKPSPARASSSPERIVVERVAVRSPTVARSIPHVIQSIPKPAGQGRWKERRRGPNRRLIGWLGGSALTVAVVVMLAGWSPSRLLRAPVYVDPDLPQGLQPRAQLFTYAWLRGDLPLMQQLTDPDQESGLVKWYQQNPEPKVPLPSSSQTELKFRVDVLESKSTHTQLKVRVEGVQIAGQPLPPLPLTWEERDSVWTFHPEGTIQGEM